MSAGSSRLTGCGIRDERPRRGVLSGDADNYEAGGDVTRQVRVVIGVLAAVAVIAIVVILTSGGEEHPSAAVVTVPVDGLDAGKAPDRTVVVPKATVAITAPRLESDLQAPPPGTPQATLQAVKRAEQQNVQTTTALPTAGATAGFAGCRTSFVRNQSSRRGVRPTLQVDHYTVSPNVKGWADVNAVVALFDRSSSQASSHFVIDAEGNCAYIVPIEAKSWTEAGGNSFSVGYEIIATGREKVYLPPAGLRKLAAVQKEVARRIGIPMRQGAVSSCSPTRSGIVQHKDFGICGGGHVDISPFSISSVVQATIALAGGKPVTAANRVTCAKINAWRRAGRPAGGQWRVNSLQRIANLKRRGVECTTKGARRL